MILNKIKIGVLIGGPSSEYDVSLMTGIKIINNLNKEKYEVLPIKISKKGDWYFNDIKIGIKEILGKINFAFIAMHGEYGEDGQIQAILEQYDVPYNGSGKFASQIAIDKSQSKKIFLNNGLITPKSVVIKYGEIEFLKKIESVLKNSPWVVKPLSKGSSVGTSIVRDRSSIFDAVHKAFTYDNYILIEEFIKGREFTCGVLENYPLNSNRKYFALPVTEIIPNEKYDFFNYNAKYEVGASKEITPAEISADLMKLIQDIAIIAHTILGCNGYSRSDFIITPKNEINILELNTLPGMTETSLLPQATYAAGIKFSELLDIIIQNGFDKYYNSI